MLKKNHLSISMSGTLAMTAVVAPQLFLNPVENALPLLGTVAGASLGAVLPDFDKFLRVGRFTLEIPSFVPRLMKKFAKLFVKAPEKKLLIDKAEIGHRSYTHSLYWLTVFLFLSLITGFFWGFQHFAFYYMQSVFFGQIFHYLADMTTKSGIPLFWPLRKTDYHILPSFLLLTTGKSPIKEPLYTFFFIFVSGIIFIFALGGDLTKLIGFLI